MEPECQAEEDDLGFQKFIEDQFEKLAQNLNDFQNTILPPPCPISLEDANELSKPSFTNHEDSPKFAQNIQHQLAMLQQDFDEFENTDLPPFHMDPMNVQNSSELEFKRDSIQGSEKKVNKRTEETTPFGVNATQDVTSYGGGGVVEVKYRFYFGSGGGGNVMSKAPRRRKRKYRGVYESEAEATLRIERQKIKNRVTAAKAYQKKQAYQLQLKAQIQKLHKDNEFQKKLLMFLEGNMMQSTPDRLKRTVSGPT